METYVLLFDLVEFLLLIEVLNEVLRYFIFQLLVPLMGNYYELLEFGVLAFYGFVVVLQILQLLQFQ